MNHFTAVQYDLHHNALERAWAKRAALLKKAEVIRLEADRAWLARLSCSTERDREKKLQEANRLWDKFDMLLVEADQQYFKVVRRVFGDRIDVDWRTGEIYG